jgi:fatty-acyl-CoA synthase
MLGYFKNDEQTAETLKDGWVHTGDLGQMDERGFVAVTGRLRDIIISGGENIYAREIEDVLMENENVGEAAVLGLPDPYWGEKVAAVIRPAAGRSTTADELTQTLESKLARYKVPKSWFVLDAMPVTASGKIQKFALQEGCLNGEIKSLD